MIRFWKKDNVNKLIVITAFLLIIAISALSYLLFNMPEGKSLKGALVEYLPTQAAPLFSSLGTPALEPTKTVLPTATLFPTLTPVATSTPQPTATPRLTASPALPVAKDCLPDHPPQTGKVLEIVDGNTARVLIDGLVYTVRYIGVGISTDAALGKAATRANGELAYAKEVMLIADETDKDPGGRLLRYVLVGDRFVNLELIQNGFAVPVASPGADSCDQIFRDAQLAPTASPWPEDQP
jgi:endonuclease YncB( thermonuclease family)